MKTNGFFWDGLITRVLFNGFKNAIVSFGKTTVYESNKTVLNALKKDYPQIDTSGTDSSKAASADWVLVALHPPVLMESLNTVKNSIRKDDLVISLAHKITIDKIKSALTDVPNTVRMNPNAGT